MSVAHPHSLGVGGAAAAVFPFTKFMRLDCVYTDTSTCSQIASLPVHLLQYLVIASKTNEKMSRSGTSGPVIWSCENLVWHDPSNDEWSHCPGGGGGGEGGLPYEKVGDARREILIWPLRGTKKGVVQAFFRPLEGTETGSIRGRKHRFRNTGVRVSNNPLTQMSPEHFILIRNARGTIHLNMK